MKQKKIAVLTTVFPSVIEFLPDFFKSLENQTVSEFDVLVVNDGMAHFESLVEAWPKLTIVELKAGSSIAKNREIGINTALELNYEVLIFGDSDDYFSPNRIAVCLTYLQTYAIVVNDLSLVEGKQIVKEKYISTRLRNQFEITLDDIWDKNFMGLSNTAINLEGTSKVKFDPVLIAVDWYFFSSLLLEKKSAIFVNEAVTYYRQYPGNTIGLNPLKKETFVQGIAAKKTHYQAMMKLNNRFRSEYHKMVSLEKRFAELEVFESKETTLNNPLWWEEIK